MSVVDLDKPKIQKADDAIIRVIRSCVCGSDLWAIGIVEEVGESVTTVKPGDFVIVPFTHGCGHCPACLAGFDGVCVDHDDNFSIGAQSQYLRFQHADWALVKVPGSPDDYSEGMLKSLLTLADVMGIGVDCVSVKATTTERLGFEGREEGISVSAVTLIYRE